VSNIKSWNFKLITSPEKISHKFRKRTQLFTTFTHNTSVDSMNKHMCCDLQRNSRTHQIKKLHFSPTVATLPELHVMPYTGVISSSDTRLFHQMIPGDNPFLSSSQLLSFSRNYLL